VYELPGQAVGAGKGPASLLPSALAGGEREGASASAQLLLGQAPSPCSSQQSEAGVKCQLSQFPELRPLNSQQAPRYWIILTHTHVC